VRRDFSFYLYSVFNLPKMLLDISSWWAGLDSFGKILWVIALLFSALFLIQTVLSFIGGYADDGGDVTGDSDMGVGDDDGMGSQYLTLKNLVAFFTMFGWAGLAAYSSGMGKALSIVVALGAGVAMVALLILLLKNVGRLKESGTMEIGNAINQVGETYLFIPPKRSGIGKVHIKIQGSLHELQAVTDDAAEIATGKMVKVTGVINDKILLVTSSF
jgi:hypothetical protein